MPDAHNIGQNSDNMLISLHIVVVFNYNKQDLQLKNIYYSFHTHTEVVIYII